MPTVILQATDAQVVDSQTNAIAVAILPAPGIGYRWRVGAYGASFSGAAAATPVRATLLAGGVTRGFGVSTSVTWQSDGGMPFDGNDNEAIVLTLPAGGVGVVGDVFLHAYKLPNNQGI